MSDDGYRGALGAAHARAAELEREVAALRAELAASPAQQARIAALATQRVAARGALDAAVARRTRNARRALGVGALGTLVFTLVIASMGSSGHPGNAFLLGVLLTLVASIAAARLSNGAATEARRVAARLDHELDALGSAAGVRVAADAARPDDAGQEREPLERAAEARRRLDP